MLDPPSRHAFSPWAIVLLTTLLANISNAQPQGPSPYNETCTTVNPSTQYITSFEEISNFQTCTTIYQPVAIAAVNFTHLDLHNIEEFKSIFEIHNCPLLQTITGLNLTIIRSDLVLDNLPLLHTLEFPRLHEVGKISWDSLPQLRSIPSFQPQSIGLSNPVESVVSRIRPTLNVYETGLERLDFFYIPTDGEKVGADIGISLNRNLALVRIGRLNNPSTNVTILGNGANNFEDTKVELDGLRTVGNLKLRRITALDFPSLTTITGSLDLSYSSITNVSLPLLTTIRGALNLVKNPLLATISLPSLQSVNDDHAEFRYLQVLDNPLLYNLSLPSLESVWDLIIFNNSQLAKIDLQKLKIVGDDFRVADNPMLLELDGFREFQHVVGELELTGNFSSIALRPPTPGHSNEPPLSKTSIRIDAYNPLFNCSIFRDSYITPTTNKEIPFTCYMHLASTTTSTTEADDPIKKGLTKEIAAVLIAVAVFGGIVCFLVGRVFLRKKHAEELRAQQYDIELAARAAGGDGDNDGDGVVRTVVPGEEADGLPAYTRVAKPGEVPPRYGEVVLGEGDVDNNGNENGVVQGERRTRGRWAFLQGRERRDGVGRLVEPEVMRL